MLDKRGNSQICNREDKACAHFKGTFAAGSLHAGNFSQSFYTHVESGRNQPSLMTIIRIAEVLETNPREFFPESEIKSKSEIKKEIVALLEAL